jgi:RimJ/RimL family protein N-acetyltransferase
MEKRHLSPLQAGRVRLRLLEERDLPRTLAWRNQDHVRRWFFRSEPLTPQQHAAWFACYRQRDDDFVFIIEEQRSRHTPCACYFRPVGQVALYNIDWLKCTAEFGRLMIGEADSAGRGLAREATAALLGLALGKFGLQEVYLEVMPSNVRAIKVYEACGFVVTGRTETTVRMSKRAAARRGASVEISVGRIANPSYRIGGG